MQRTSIEWTDFTANPLKFRRQDGVIVWACVHTSPGCVNCYAETLAHRYGRGGPFNAQMTAKLTPFMDDAEAKRMLNMKAASGSRCFVGDMTDVFGGWVADSHLDKLFALFENRPDVTWQVLTKRASRMRDYLTTMYPTPLPNVWLGVSCEDQQRADERIPHLLQTPAAVRFISAEPLIGPVHLYDHWIGDKSARDGTGPALEWSRPWLDWVIVGGESGPGARVCHTNWIRSLVWECKAAGVPCFVKQLGSRPICQSELDTALFHKTMKSRKGGDPSEWPADLRVREFPQANS